MSDSGTSVASDTSLGEIDFLDFDYGSARPLDSVADFLDEERWDKVRKRLKRLGRSPRRIGQLIYHVADKPNVPSDIIETLFSKIHGKRFGYPYEKFRKVSDSDFWLYLCAHVEKDGQCAKTFRTICRKQSMTNLRIFLSEYRKVFGRMHQRTAGNVISELWCSYLCPNYDPRRGRGDADRGKEEVLFNVTSMDDLQSKEDIQDLWQRTELIMKMSTKHSLEASVDEFPLISLMIQAQVQKVVVWIAVRLCPAHLRIKDGRGRLPLHWAAVWNDRQELKKKPNVVFQGSLLGLNDKTMLELVLDPFPAAAGCPDVEGSHPLALLLQQECKGCINFSLRVRCMHALMKQAPHVLLRRNKRNFLLPFVAAASMSSKNIAKIEVSAPEVRGKMLNSRVNQTYELLRANPLALANLGTEPRSRVLCLERELDEVLHEVRKLQEENQKLQMQVSVLKKKDGLDLGNPGTESSQRPTKRSRK